MNISTRNPIRRIDRLLLLVMGASLLILARCESNAPPDDNNPPPPGPGSNPPAASAGADLVVNAGDSVTLDGSASSDPDGDAISFSWQQTLGTPVSLSSTTAPIVTFTAPENGTTLMFELTVSDGQSSSVDTINVSVMPVDSSVQVVEFRPSTSVRDDPFVQGNLPPSYVVERPPEMPAAQKEGGANALFGSTQFAPLAEVQLAPGATHEVELQVAGPSVLLGSARWIGTTELLSLSVSLDGTSLANGDGFVSGPDRGGSNVTVRTMAAGLARLSVTNTTSATASVWIIFGALSLGLLE